MPEQYFSTLRAANDARQTIWDNGTKLDLAYRANELAGETGEACNVAKKIECERRGLRGSRASIEQLADELADVVICADLVARTEGIDLDAAIVRKFNNTSCNQGFDIFMEPVSATEIMHVLRQTEDFLISFFGDDFASHRPKLAKEIARITGRDQHDGRARLNPIQTAD